ncbi:molybdenum cofactor guanylyltransferase [Georgenia sp. AZ-5]|uniref:molybdenum cofactor guanylyltransferase n=1 Tax=Georgenia sp. AZ-5 TaxID=3367526 RepID=UPI00375533FF
MTPGRGATPAFDAVVLAGGTARRLGGASKPDVVLGGRRLLEHALDAAAGARRTVVVAPPEVAVPPGVLRTLEDPPHGGPVAGIAAGLAALDAAATSGSPAADGAGPAPWLLVLACDVPYAADAVPRLLAAAVTGDGACLVDGDGHAQWLTGVYRTAALRERLGALPDAGRGASVHRCVGPLATARVRAAGREAVDVDSWADLDALGADGAPLP